jgi:hypothetical protein
MNRVNIFLMITLFSGCQGQNDSNLNEAFDSFNDPGLMQINYVTTTFGYKNNLSELSTDGKMPQELWSGDYWPTFAGGITHRWNSSQPYSPDAYGYDLKNYGEAGFPTDLKILSPAEKIDLFLGTDVNSGSSMTSIERQRTEVMRTVPGSSIYDPNFKIADWQGLCHAWAPATALYVEPGPVTVQSANGVDVDFGASDIKALLTYFLHSTDGRSSYLGRRCNVNFKEKEEKLAAGDITRAEYEAVKNLPQCRDTNAGSFHIVLANQISRYGESFIIDATRDQQVWNQAVYSYTSDIGVPTTSAIPSNAAPGTVSIVNVKTNVQYVTEVPQNWSGNTAGTSASLQDFQLEYTLELDSSGKIVGGEWITEQRPDFIWKQAKPSPTRPIFTAIMDIYSQSIR